VPRDYTALPNNQVLRRDRVVEDEGWIEALLGRAALGTLATVHEGQPFINSNLFVYDPAARAIYLHTARAGRTRANIEGDERVCFSVSEMGRLLPADTALEFSVEYAGVTVFGRGAVIADREEGRRALQLPLDKYAPQLRPGRDYRATTDDELARTTVYRVAIDNWSGKKKEAPADFPGAFHYDARSAPVAGVSVAADGGDGAAVGDHDLTGFGDVPATYRHHDRVVAPGEDLVLPGARLKWYDLHRAEVAVPRTFAAESRAFLAHEAAAGALELGYGLGFVVLHFSDPLAYLIVGTWRNYQELWETLYIRDPARDDGFRRMRPGADAPTLCVWELAPVWHEREAWVRYLRSSRDGAAKRAYLADRLLGRV